MLNLNSTSIISLFLPNFLLIKGTVNDPPSTTDALIIESVPRREALAIAPPSGCGEALITATGLFTNSPDDTTQSSAFFKDPGTPLAYSGEHISTPLAFFRILRQLATAASMSSKSKSGLK